MSDHNEDKCAILADMKQADRTALKEQIKAEMTKEAEIERKNNFETAAWASLMFGIFSIPMAFFYHFNTATDRPSGFAETTGNVAIAYVESAAFFVTLGFVGDSLR
jgi:hypothetical protein